MKLKLFIYGLAISLFLSNNIAFTASSSIEIEADIRVISCPRHHLDILSRSEYQMIMDQVFRKVEEYCGVDEGFTFLKIEFGDDTIGWGGTNPGCGFYRHTEMGLSFICPS